MVMKSRFLNVHLQKASDKMLNFVLIRFIGSISLRRLTLVWNQ